MKKCDGNHQAAENARCFDIECWDDVNRAFNIWWHNEGSGMPPRRDEDAYEHVHRVAQIAWSNGYYTANHGMNELQAQVERLEKTCKWCGVQHHAGENTLCPVTQKDKRIAELEHSRDLCHHYAGCTAINCCLDGDDCPESRSKSHE